MRAPLRLLLALLLLSACGAAPARRSPPAPPPPAAPAFAAPGAFRAGKIAAADGVPIAYTEAGSGEPAVLFIHCWGCDRSFWEGAMRTLAPSRHVVALDLPGHGESGSDRKEWSVAGFGDDVARLVDALGLGKVVLVGHSAGGAVALDAAGRLPGRVVGVVGVDTLHDVEAANKAAMQELLDGLARDFVPTCRTFVGSIFGAAAPPDLVSRVQGKMCGNRPEIALPILRAVLAWDQARGLAAMKVPVRCIQGDKFPTNLEGNRRHHTDFDVIVLPGTGHFPQLESPQDFDRALQDVLRSLPSS